MKASSVESDSGYFILLPGVEVDTSESPHVKAAKVNIAPTRGETGGPNYAFVHLSAQPISLEFQFSKTVNLTPIIKLSNPCGSTPKEIKLDNF